MHAKSGVHLIYHTVVLHASRTRTRRGTFLEAELGGINTYPLLTSLTQAELFRNNVLQMPHTKAKYAGIGTNKESRIDYASGDVE